MSKILLAIVAAGSLLFGVAFATPDPAGALTVSTVSTAGLTNLEAMVTGALPYIAGAIGLGIVLRWVRRMFKF